MNTTVTNRFILWGLVFLAIINLSALTTFFVVSRNARVEPQGTSEIKPGRVLKTELSLNQDQELKVQKINSTYRTQSKPIVDSIKSAKTRLLEELSKEQSDMQNIKVILETLGIHQKNLQQANVQQFLELKKVCNPEQTLRLSEIYAELYGCEPKGKGKGEGKGMKHRHRYGQQKRERK